MADVRYRVTAASITLHPRQVLRPEATPEDVKIFEAGRLVIH
jgi:hypothetical protein